MSGYNKTNIHDDPDGLTFEDGNLNPYVPATQFSFVLDQPYKTYSTELRLVSAAGSRWEYTAGVYWKKTDLSEFADLALFGETIQFDTSDKQTAVFGEVGYKFTDAWESTAGARYLWEKLSASTLTTIAGLGSSLSANNGDENNFSRSSRSSTRSTRTSCTTPPCRRAFVPAASTWTWFRIPPFSPPTNRTLPGPTNSA